MVFRPASLNSRFHRRLAQAVDRSHVKANRVRKVRACRASLPNVGRVQRQSCGGHS